MNKDFNSDKGKPRTAAAPPRALNVHKFAESRASELESLHSIVKDRLNNDFKSQRNKRRRTTGHDNKAVKARARKKQKTEANDNVNNPGYLEKDKKTLSRHVRRKIELTKNIQDGFSTTGDGTKRLRTHLWHAKRFTMTKLWGFYLPLGVQGRGRGSRAVLKKLKGGVLVHDASYYSAVQLEGPEDLLLSILKTVLVPSPCSHCEDTRSDILSGAIGGTAELRHVGAISQIIAPVTYMWQPQQCSNADTETDHANTCGEQQKVDGCAPLRRLLVWIHAAAFKEGYNALQNACERQLDAAGSRISCTSLENHLGKLEVMGSRASKLLQKILHPATCFPLKTSVEKYASCIENDGQVPSSAILSLSVHDPRFLNKDITNALEAKSQDILSYKKDENRGDRTPKRGMKLLPCSFLEPDGSHGISECVDLWDAKEDIPPPIEESILCMEKHRQRMELFRIGDMNSGRQQPSVDGRFSRFCPILLQKSDNQKASIIRWSIILPLCWIKVFWISLVINGAQVIGLREKQWIACELGLPCFPREFPDCNAHSCLMALEESAYDKKSDLRCPHTRAWKVPVSSPWDSVRLALEGLNGADLGQIQHEQLPPKDMIKNIEMNKPYLIRCKTESESSSSAPFEGFVARTSHVLTQFLAEINGSHLLLFPKVLHREKTISKFMKDERMLNEDTDGVIYQIKQDQKLCLVRILLHAYREGSFEEGAVVCAPHIDDIMNRSERSKGELQVPESFVRSCFSQQETGKWEFQVPEDPAAKESCRLPIGFITTGFVRGSKKPVAVALCEAVCIARLREEQWKAVGVKKRRKEIYVLVRNLRSTVYRLALASIVLEQGEDDLECM